MFTNIKRTNYKIPDLAHLLFDEVHSIAIRLQM